MTETRDRVIDPAALTKLLARRHPGVEVASVGVMTESSGSANRLHLRITYAPGTDAGLPATMFLKRNLERFEFPVEMYTTEVRVYRDVLPGTGVEAPTVYAVEAAGDGIEFSLLLEDIGARPGGRVGFVLDPTTGDDVDRLLGTLARLHLAFWGRTGEARVAWTRPPVEDASMRFWAEIGPRLARRHLESGHRAQLVDPTRWPQDELWRAFARLLVVDGEGPLTVLHGDVHAGNVYHLPDADGGLFDWQLCLRGCWALDVGYLLTSTLSIEDRRTHERDLLAGYLARLAAGGVDAPGSDEAWLRYRQNALYGLAMWLITPDGVHTDDAQVEYLQRCVTAAEDLDTMEALV